LQHLFSFLHPVQNLQPPGVTRFLFSVQFLSFFLTPLFVNVVPPPPTFLGPASPLTIWSKTLRLPSFRCFMMVFPSRVSLMTSLSPDHSSQTNCLHFSRQRPGWFPHQLPRHLVGIEPFRLLDPVCILESLFPSLQPTAFIAVSNFLRPPFWVSSFPLEPPSFRQPRM